jgi:hypothetical protein
MNNNNSKFARGVEISMNISIIVLALIGATVLVKDYLLRSQKPAATEVQQTAAKLPPTATTSAPPKTGPVEGTQLNVPGVAWNESNETILLALSKGCHFCSQSAPFYQKLTQQLAQRKDVRVIAVLPQEVGEAKQYLDELGVPIRDVRQASLNSIGVRGTPTLIIVDNAGKVKQSWIGQLNTERESEVLSRLGT